MHRGLSENVCGGGGFIGLQLTSSPVTLHTEKNEISHLEVLVEI